MELIDRVRDEDNIYEFDLEQFFPSVNLAEIEVLMVDEYKFPRHIARYLTKLNQSITVLTKDDKLNEDNDRKVLLTPSNLVNPNLEENMKRKVEEIISREGFQERDLKHLLPDSSWRIHRTHGVPQGAGTSCSLSTISLSKLWVRLKGKLLMYADDGLAFVKKLIEIRLLNDLKRGVKMNPDKSR